MAESLKFDNGWLVLPHTLLDMWLVVHAGMIVIPR